MGCLHHYINTMLFCVCVLDADMEQTDDEEMTSTVILFSSARPFVTGSVVTLFILCSLHLSLIFRFNVTVERKF